MNNLGGHFDNDMLFTTHFDAIYKTIPGTLKFINPIHGPLIKNTKITVNPLARPRFNQDTQIRAVKNTGSGKTIHKDKKPL